MPKTSGLLRSNDNEDLSRNDLFTVHKEAIYFGMFNFHRKEDQNNAKNDRIGGKNTRFEFCDKC